MNKLSLYRLIVFSNLWVSLAAASFSLLSARYFNTPHAFWFVFSGTMTVYCLQRWVKYFLLGERTGQQKEDWMAQNVRLFLSIAGVSFLIFLYWIYTMQSILWTHWVGFLLAGTIAIWYVIPFFFQNLRDVPYTKIVWVVGVYVYFSSILPYSSRVILSHETWTFVAALFAYILGMTILFDLRDLAVDDPKKKTLPQVLGEKGAFVLSVFLVGIALVLICALMSASLTATVLLFTCHVMAYMFGWRRRRNEQYISFVFEGLIAFTGWVLFVA